MPAIFHFKGFIRDVRYHAHLNSPLTSYSLDDFDINAAKSFGQIDFPAGQIS